MNARKVCHGFYVYMYNSKMQVVVGDCLGSSCSLFAADLFDCLLCFFSILFVSSTLIFDMLSCLIVVLEILDVTQHLDVSQQVPFKHFPL